MENDLRDKVAIVTGGASGLGRATAIALAEEGAIVVIADIDVEGGEEVAQQLDGHFVRVDVSDLESNRAMVAYATEKAGGVDLAFLNAGVVTGCGVGEDFDLDKYRRAMSINQDGPVFGVVACLPAMQRRGQGAIVCTASLAGLTAVPYDPVYAANKHGVVGLCRSLGALKDTMNIRVNAVCPGFSESKIIKDIREGILESGLPIIPAEQVAEAVLALFKGDMSGEAWFVQMNRAGAFGFRGVPGPRVEA